MNQTDYDFDNLNFQQIIDYVYFFEKTKIDNVEQVSHIIKILINKFLDNMNNANNFFINNARYNINNKMCLNICIYAHFKQIYYIFTNNDTCYVKNLSTELANIYLMLFNQIMTEFNVYDENVLFDFIKNYVLLKKFINQKNNEFYKHNKSCKENIFNELMYLLDKFFFDANDVLTNKIINDLKTIDVDNEEKYYSIIATLDDYLYDIYDVYKEKSIFKDLVEKINVKLFADDLMSDISNLEKDKLTMYFHEVYHK